MAVRMTLMEQATREKIAPLLANPAAHDPYLLAPASYDESKEEKPDAM